MYHSVTFGDKNTWDDWHLIPKTRPLFKTPSQKTKILDIPGGNGVLDLSTSLTGYPIFNNREGTLEFAVVNGFKPWYQAVTDISEHLHGKTMKAILEDDLEYFYEGRFNVNEWKSDKSFSTIGIDYSVNPYKWCIKTSLDDWLWNPFNLKTGVILSGAFSNIPLKDGVTVLEYDRNYTGTAPVCPKLRIHTETGNGVDIYFVDEIRGVKYGDLMFHANEGVNQFPEIFFMGNPVEFHIDCTGTTGTISIDFRPGRL